MKEYSNLQSTNALPEFLENSVVKPFYHTNLREPLEHIVLKEKPDREKSSLEKVFSDKSKTAKAGVKALLDEIS